MKMRKSFSLLSDIKIRQLWACYLQVPKAPIFLKWVVLNLKFPGYWQTNILLSLSSKYKEVSGEKNVGPVLEGQDRDVIYQLSPSSVAGIFIKLFFLSSHLCFTYKSWYFGLAHKQHEAALNALIFPAYCKPDSSPASIILKGTAYVKPHQKAWSPYKSVFISHKRLHSSLRGGFGSPCFSVADDEVGQRDCPLYHFLPFGSRWGKHSGCHWGERSCLV